MTGVELDMPKEVMNRTSSDNIYLHQDFHIGLNLGIQYLHQHYGENAVREYIRQCVLSFFSPLIEDIKKQGLIAIKEHYDRIYRLEGVIPKFDLSENKLTIAIDACPAVLYLRKKNIPVEELFFETTKTMNEILCEGTPFFSILSEYDKQSGASIQNFYRRKKK